MRLLPERPNYDREGHARQGPQSDRHADPRDDERDALPLHDVLPCANRHQACGENDRGHQTGRQERGGGMTSGIPKHIDEILTANRRSFLKSTGMLAVGFGVNAGPLLTDAAAQMANGASYIDPDYHQ